MKQSQAEPGRHLVEMRDIWKLFPGVVANKGVDLEFRAGEVHALLGENGAGKTTLMNILSGLYRPDSGVVLLDGSEVEFRSPAQAISAGIGMVHQHFCLVDKLSVAANLHLGWSETPRLVSPAKLMVRTQEICARFGMDVDPEAKIWQLSVGEQQRVEIVRVLARGARVLILDEPTAVLTPGEADELFQHVRLLAAEGRVIVFISHKLDEVLAVSDRITVLRGGCNVETCPTSQCDHRMLARLMVGEEIVSQVRRKTMSEEGTVLELRNASVLNDRGLLALKDVSLSIQSGEILGVAGVAGNGQGELAEVTAGLRRLECGTIRLDGRDITGKSPRTFAGLGIGHIPEDRIATGLVPDCSVADNVVLREYSKPPITKRFKLDRREVVRIAKEIVREAGVRVPGIQVAVGTLSGGNQQRLLARREIRLGSRLLVAVHPTRGLDVAATDAVRYKLMEHRNNGGAILLISEDLDEILALSDRTVVMYEGRIVQQFGGKVPERERIGLAMGGHLSV
jgi:ABC-type uncharacterized transport system ATPase subunit